MTSSNVLALLPWKLDTDGMSTSRIGNFAYNKNKSWFVNCMWSRKTVNDYKYLLGFLRVVHSCNWSCSLLTSYYNRYWFLFGTWEVLAWVDFSPSHDLKLSHVSCHSVGLKKDFILDSCGNSYVEESPTDMLCLVPPILLMKSLSRWPIGVMWDGLSS